MDSKKIFLLGILSAAILTQALHAEEDSIPLKKTMLIAGGVLCSGAAVGYGLYKYFTCMTFSRAEKWCHDVTGYIEQIAVFYNREFAMLDNSCDVKAHKKELEEIITSINSRCPFLYYTEWVEDSLMTCINFEKKMSSGILQLKAESDNAIMKLGQGLQSDTNKQDVETQLKGYQDILKSITNLSELLHTIHGKLHKLLRYCQQFDAYRQEKILDQMRKIETRLIFVH